MKSKLRWNFKQILGRPDGNNHSTPIQRELYQREHDLPESLPHVIVGITQQQPEPGHLERVSSLARSITITDTQRISSFFSLTMLGQVSSPAIRCNTNIDRQQVIFKHNHSLAEISCLYCQPNSVEIQLQVWDPMLSPSPDKYCSIVYLEMSSWWTCVLIILTIGRWFSGI